MSELNASQWLMIEKLIEQSQKPILPRNEFLESLDVNKDQLNYCRFFYHYITQFKPRVILEIGVEVGITSAYMCVAAKTYGGLVIGIDNRPDPTKLVTITLPTQFYY